MKPLNTAQVQGIILRGREVKVRKLAAVIDAELRAMTLDPESPGAVDFIAQLKAADWNEYAAQAECRVPSEDSRKAVLEFYRARINEKDDPRVACASCDSMHPRSEMRRAESGDHFCRRCCDEAERWSGNGRTMGEHAAARGGQR